MFHFLFSITKRDLKFSSAHHLLLIPSQLNFNTEQFTWVHVTFWVGPVLIVLCDLLPVARWWSMGFWSVHPHPSGCSPLDACLSHWFSTVSLSCLRWYMTQNTVRSWLTTVNLRYKMDPGGGWAANLACGWVRASENDEWQLLWRFCYQSTSWLLFPGCRICSPLKKPSGRFSILHHTNTSYISSSRSGEGGGGSSQVVAFFSLSFNFRCGYWCQSSEAITTGPSAICSSHR